MRQYAPFIPFPFHSTFLFYVKGFLCSQKGAKFHKYSEFLLTWKDGVFAQPRQHLDGFYLSATVFNF